MSDAAALALLDRLLDLDPESRRAELAQLATLDPLLHARLVKLCDAATGENSHVLAQPVIDGLRLAQQPAALVSRAGEVFAGYRLVRELGRGGMAVVWLAEREDGVIKRPVALKLPLCAVSPLESQRFAREKDVLAALSHPHIARMYDAGVAPTGQPYIVLEYIDGAPITTYCDWHKLTIEARLRLFLDVLAAVDHAHKHLVVHRDLKPSNILVDQQGAVKLLDFGIARLLADPAADGALPELTQHGGLALTPLYAAPEQVRAQPISTLTDVYILGAVLHELLAGTGPHALSVRARPSLAEWVEAVSRPVETHVRNAPMDDEAARRRGLANAQRLRNVLTGDLDVIVQKAMRHEPLQRYASVAHFAEDVRRYLAREPLAARPTSVWYAAGLFMRRNRAVSVVAALGAAVSLTAGLIALQKQSESRMYEARSAAVRDFMFDFVNDVEPNELQPDVPVPFIDMLGAAVARARADFRDRPQLQGELLSELGRMYGTVGEPQDSAQIVSEALAILERSAPGDDPALNKARTYQASILLDENDIARARALVLQARDACTRDNVDCAKARSYALTLLARIELMDGLPGQALATQRKAVEETTRAFGRQNEMTVISLRALAVVARNSGHLIEAAAVMKEAVEIAGHVTLRRSDRLTLERTMAVGDLDMGRYRAARERLAKLIPGVRDSEERALQLRLLANALLAEGDPRAALDAADSALKLSGSVQGDAEPQFARQARSRALSLLGETVLGLADIARVIEGLRALDYDETSTEVLRARRFHSEMLLRAGQFEEAWAELQLLLAQLDAAPEPPPLEWGQVLDLAGCTLRELKRFPEAAAIHGRARIELQKQLTSDHPFLVRNALYKEAVAKDRGEFERQAAVAKQMFRPDSQWARLIDAELDAEACPKTGLKLCVFVL